MTAKLRELIRTVRRDYPTFSKTCLKIRTKAGEVKPFVWNKSQEILHSKLEEQLSLKGYIRAVILKGRQQGISTYTEGRIYFNTIGRKGCRSFILTHEAEATKNLFEMTKRYHDYCPGGVKPVTGSDSSKSLDFPNLDSSFRVGTAGNRSTGRGSTVQLFHGCLAGDMKILTPDRREVEIRNVAVNDEVITHTGKIAKVSFKSEQDKQCYRLKVFGTNRDIECSAEHQFLTMSGWKELKAINDDDYLAYPIPVVSEKISKLPFKQPDNQIQQGGGKREDVPDDIPLNYDVGRIVGLYLAEGVVSLQSKAPHAPASVSFAVHDHEVERTLEWLKPLSDFFKSAKGYSRKDCKTSVVTVYGKSFACFINDLVGRTDEKRLPNNWNQFGPEFVRGMVHGYLSGDGHSSKRQYDRRISAPSIREAITYGMRDALASLGYGWAVVNYRPGAIRHGRNEKAQWTLRLSGKGVDQLCSEIGWKMPERKRVGRSKSKIGNGFVWLPVESIEPSEVKKVYDLEIDHPDHSYLMPQCASHNSEVAFWPHAEEHLAGILQAVPKEDGTEVILESTANGVGGVFYDYCMDAKKGKGDFILIFLPWYWQDEYQAPVPNDFERTDEESTLVALLKNHPDGKEFNVTLTDEQLQWRRNKIYELKSLDKFKQEYPCWIDEAFLFSGRAVFDPNHTVSALAACRDPEARYEVGLSGTWIKGDSGRLSVWQQPKKTFQYVIGVDVAEGLAHGDKSSIDVLNEKGKQVAHWNGHIPPDELAMVIKSLAKKYNNAFVGVERNNHGLTTITKLLDEKVPNLFIEKDVETSAKRTKRRPGWLTTSKSKPLIIDRLAELLRDGESGIRNIDTVRECQTYVIEDNGSFNAQEGCFDDRVMSLAIAHEMLRQMPRHINQSNSTGFTADSRAGY